MKIKNVSTSNLIIPEIKDNQGAGLVLAPNAEVMIFNEDAEKSTSLAVYMSAVPALITKIGDQEPGAVGINFMDYNDTTGVATLNVKALLIPLTARPDLGAYANLLNLNDGGGSALPLVGAMTGGANQKTYAISVNVNRPSTAVATLDSNDAILRGNFNNHAACDANFIMRGINVSLNNRSGGVLGMLDNLLGNQGKSGGTIGTIRGLTVVPENYGTVSNEFSGIAVEMKNEGAVATLEYGIRIRNLNNSLATAVTSAILVGNSGANIGFTTGLDLNGATLVNEIVFSNGIKVTVSGDNVVFTNAGATASATIALV